MSYVPRLAPADTALIVWATTDFRRVSLIALNDGNKLLEWKQEELELEPARTLFSSSDLREWHRNAYDCAAKQGLLERA